MMFELPPVPDVPASQTASHPVKILYADVCQDGRPRVTAFAHALGPVLWRGLLHHHPIAPALRQRGIAPILSRFQVQSGSARVMPNQELMGHGGFQLAHARDDAGQVNRLIVTMWLSLSTRTDSAEGPPDVGRMFAEHVLTRPLAPTEQRKVLSLDIPDIPAVPEALYTWQPPERVLALPAGATAPDHDHVHDDQLRLDSAATVFGIDDTDQNQHVNSMVYPRVFIQAALRRFAALGRSAALLAREVEVSYRKPCFAGQSMRVVLRAFEHQGRPGALGCMVADDDARHPDTLARVLAEGRAHCYLKMLFAP
jgi:acyl-CoA thioesterase FadM